MNEKIVDYIISIICVILIILACFIAEDIINYYKNSKKCENNNGVYVYKVCINKNVIIGDNNE